jgi:alkylation response protein AidB-like acyl-CoA dehydrogenase
MELRLLTRVCPERLGSAYAISKEYKIERIFRDAKIYELLEGTSEVQRELTGKHLPR